MAVGTLSFYAPDVLEQRLKEAARRERRTLSNYIRVVLEDRLDEEGIEPLSRRNGDDQTSPGAGEDSDRPSAAPNVADPAN